MSRLSLANLPRMPTENIKRKNVNINTNSIIVLWFDEGLTDLWS